MLQRELWLLGDDSGPRYMDERVLVDGLQCGDARAVEYAVKQYAPALYRFAYYQLHDASLAEDLVGEVMVRMVEHIDGFVVQSVPLEAWLYRITRNLITDHYRRKTRRPQMSLEEWLENRTAREPGKSDAGIEIIPDREQLRAGLARLTEEQRVVVLLHVIEEWELPSIARLLGRTVPSVKSLYYRGIQSLRRVLDTKDDQEK
jgi:RNA polymerase sigma-70 factor, ECF subfamily